MTSVDGDNLAVDTDELRRGGVDIGRVAETAGSIFNDLHGACVLYANAGGDGEIGSAVHKQYKPGEGQGLEFLRQIGGSLQADGERVQTLAGVYEDADSTATDAVHSHGRK